MEKWLIAAGISGTTIAALCCFTPAVTIVLGIAGLLAWQDSVDRMALPLLAVSLLVLAIGIVQRRRHGGGLGP